MKHQKIFYGRDGRINTGYGFVGDKNSQKFQRTNDINFKTGTVVSDTVKVYEEKENLLIFFR